MALGCIPQISVVVPARNEEGTIAQVVARSFAVFEELGCWGEVLVVDDGGADKRELTALAERYVDLTVYTHRRRA